MPGVRVVEIGIWVAGPTAGGVLADWGADVVKIESPAGDGRSFWLIGVKADRHWPTLLRILGRAEWATDECFTTRVAREQNSVELIALLDAERGASPVGLGRSLRPEPSFFWAPVNRVAEAIADPQTTASGAFVEVADGSYDRRMVASHGDFHGTRGASGREPPDSASTPTRSGPSSLPPVPRASGHRHTCRTRHRHHRRHL
jgi:crotonobetainyl-CoA:carnitine CoA-transferase CaiB-like acyl-CoA transferase